MLRMRDRGAASGNDVLGALRRLTVEAHRPTRPRYRANGPVGRERRHEWRTASYQRSRTTHRLDPFVRHEHPRVAKRATGAAVDQPVRKVAHRRPHQ